MKRKIKEALLWVWQLPQNLLGLCLLLYYKHEKEYHRLNGRRFYFTKEMPSGISLGNYIIMNRADKEDGMRHEYGHSIQSRWLGLLYLPTIGLLSGIWNLIDVHIVSPRIGYKASYKLYYSMPWEAWADKLGKVDRQKEYDKIK